jgi:adenylate cyclase
VHDLVFLSGARAGEVVPLSVPGLVLGRSAECDCEVPDPNSSRRHAELRLIGDRVTLVDIGSANGTWVNEERVREKQLQTGDIVRIGDTRIQLQARSGPSEDGFDLTVVPQENAAIDLSVAMLDELPEREVTLDTLQRRLKVVSWVSEVLASLEKLDDIYKPILETLFEIFPQVERGFVLRGDSVDTLEPLAMLHRRAEGDHALTVSRSLCKAAIERRSVLVYSAGGEHDFDEGMSLIALDIRSAMVVPLLVHEEVLGLLVMDTSDPRRSFNQEEMELAATVCRQIAAAIHIAQLLREIQAETENRRNLMRFLPKPVVDQVQAGAVDLTLGGRSYHGTVFFSDVVGFTRLSETLDPEVVVANMNAYFNRMVPCIRATGGAIDKFMGDAILAFWGIPLGDGMSASHAIQAALSMHNALAGFNAEQLRGGRPMLDMAIGVSTGPVVAGNVGAKDRLEYTVLGNTVNTAKRIEERACWSMVLASDTTWQQAEESGIYGFLMPEAPAKNLAEWLRTYSVRGIETFGGEILLHIVLRCGEHRVFLVRRLADQHFIVLHPGGCRLDGTVAVMALPECQDQEIGPMKVVEQLPMQTVDGGMVRSVVQVPDATLGGLLQKDAPQRCGADWSHLTRARLPS